jgi:glycosyltransferase involved in cell wall biosynthesis
MRILVIHNRYAMRAGEDAAVDAETRLLQERGHEVALLLRDNRSVGPTGWARQAFRVAWNKEAHEEVRSRLRQSRPDLVHVHNFFPLWSPSVFAACRDERVPSVHTLHNYRLLCAVGTLFRDGRPCIDCVHGSPYRAVLHGCYRSRLASLPAAHLIAAQRRRGSWDALADRFIAPTEFVRQAYASAGLPAEWIMIKPPFVPDATGTDTSPEEREGALFVGRLIAEKGIPTLLSAWRGLEIPLTIIGGGYQSDLIRREANPWINLLGERSSAEVAAAMRRARFLVMPSAWFEPFGLVLVEAFRAGLPVVASRVGATEEVVEDGRTGLFCEPGDSADLRRQVCWAHEHPAALAEMGRQGRAAYHTRYTPERSYRRLIEIYAAAMAS